MFQVNESYYGKLIGMTLALLVSAQAAAEDRSDVLKRIEPIGRVSVENQMAAPAPVAEEAAPAAEAEAPAEAPTETAEAAPAAAGEEDIVALATANGCLACHQVEVKVVGPSYKEVAAKYKGDAGAEDMLVNKVLNGGVGTWGQIPMPPNLHVGEEKVRKIVAWVLTF